MAERSELRTIYLKAAASEAIRLGVTVAGADARMPDLQEAGLRAVAAHAVEHSLDDAVLMMGDNGVTVYDNQDHYHRGTPQPLPIREWLAKKAREGDE